MTKFCQNASGRDARLYINLGTVTVPVWTEIPEAQDITLPWTAEEIENPERSSRFKLYDSGPEDFAINTTLTFRAGNANAKLIRDAMIEKCAYEYLALSGDIGVAGNEGLRIGLKTFGNTHSYPSSGQANVDIVLKPSHFEETDLGGASINPGVHVEGVWYVAA